MVTEVKICGIKTPEIMEAALDAGADYVGLVFFEKSPRNIALDEAAKLARLARKRAKVVALVVDAPDDLLERIANVVEPDYVQLHGSETPLRMREIKGIVEGDLIKAVPVSTRANAVEGALRYGAYEKMVLFDAKPPRDAERPGGNGVPFDWRIVAKLGEVFKFMLSGGLTPDNVAEAIRIAEPPAVDVSSGVETAPGVKDAALIRKFIEAVRRAA